MNDDTTGTGPGTGPDPGAELDARLAARLAALIPQPVAAERERIRQLAIRTHAVTVSPTGRMTPFEELLRHSPEENAELLLQVVDPARAAPCGCLNDFEHGPLCGPAMTALQAPRPAARVLPGDLTADSDDPEIPVRLVQLWLCDPCLDGKGGECHTPGCSLWLNRAPDITLRNDQGVTVMGIAHEAFTAGQQETTTPGQAAYEAFYRNFATDEDWSPPRWADLADVERAGWKAAAAAVMLMAQAAVDYAELQELRAELAKARGELRQMDEQARRAIAAEATAVQQAEGELAKARDMTGVLASLCNMYVRGLYAAWIDAQRGDLKAVIECLAEGLDGFEGPEWNGTETGTEWHDRTAGDGDA